jgi:hypothetical protein
MAVGDFFKHIGAEPFTKLYHPLLMTGWTEMSSFARKGQEVFMSAVTAFNPGKTIMQDSAVKIPENNFLYIWPEKTVLLAEPFIIHMLKSLEVVFNTTIILRTLRLTWTVLV